jgi:hypothetical protein
MKKRTTTKWLEDSTYRIDSSVYNFYKKDLEEIYSRFVNTGATYCYIIDDEVDFYIETEETDEEYFRRIKNEEEAKKLVEKVEFERAKEIYLKLKDIFE